MKKLLLCIWAMITISNLSAQDNANTKVFWKENFNSPAASPIGWKKCGSVDDFNKTKTGCYFDAREKSGTVHIKTTWLNTDKDQLV